MGAFARRAAGAIGDRNEIGFQRGEPAIESQSDCSHLRGLRRKELERNAEAARPPVKRLARGIIITPPRVSKVARAGCADRGRAIAIPRSSFRPGRQVSWRNTSRPAPSSHCVTASGAKPSRRWACSSRKNRDRVPRSRRRGAVRRAAARAPLHGSLGAVVEEVQHLMDDDDVEGIPRQRQIVNVALADAAMFQTGAIQSRPGERQHVERQIKPEPALNVAGEKFEHAAGAGAKIEQRADRLFGECLADRAFHGGVGGMELADPVPFGGMPAEIILRGRGAGGPDAENRSRSRTIIGSRRRAARSVRARCRAAPVRPAEKMSRLPRGNARPARPRLRASGGGTVAAAIGARFDEVRNRQFGLCKHAKMRSRVASPAAFSVRSIRQTSLVH